MLIDSHCHLDYFTEAERPEILARALAAGVGGMVTIGTRTSRASEQLALTDAVPGLWCTVGTHPHHAGDDGVPDEQALVDLAAHPRVIGIGEAGLDYFYEKAPRDAQAAAFRAQIRAARRAGMPICIHTRDADEDTYAILKDEQEQGGAFAFLLHCFSSGRALAETCGGDGRVCQLLRHSDVSEVGRAAGDRGISAGGPASGGDGLAVSGAGAVPWAPQ